MLSLDKQAPLVSVIMPCYNVAPWVEEAVRSLAVSGLADGEMEVIALNDGSRDETPEILHRLAEELPCLQVITTENHGLGWQRNNGLSMARGRYVYYFDSDDMLVPGALKLLTDLMEAEALDAVWFEADTFYESEALKESQSGYAEYYHRKTDYPQVMNGRDLFTALRLRSEWRPSACLQLARRDLILDHGILFPVDCALEDNLYSLRVAHAAQRARCIHDRLYLRRIRSGSIMTANAAAKQLHGYAVMLPGVMAYLPQKDEGDADYRRAILMQLDSICTEVRKLASDLPPEAAAALPPETAWLIRCASLWAIRQSPAEQTGDLAALQAENRSLKAEKAERWKELQAVRAERQELIRERGELKKERGERWNENEAIKKDLNARIRALNAEKQSLREQLQSLDAAHQAHTKSLEEQRKSLMQERHYLRTQLAEQFTLMDRARRSVLVRAGMRLHGLDPKSPPTQDPKDQEQ